MTSRMHTDISPGQWQPWTAVSPLLGLINNFFFVLPTKPPCYAGYVTTDHCDASCPLAIWCRYAFSVKSNRCAQQASASRQVYEILISYPDLPRPRKTEWDLGTRLMKSSPEEDYIIHELKIVVNSSPIYCSSNPWLLDARSVWTYNARLTLPHQPQGPEEFPVNK